MKKIYTFLAILSVPAILLFYSFHTGSPGGKTGSPLDNANCTQCHTGATNPIDNWISSDIPAEGFTPGQTYVITLTGTDPIAVRMGFELTAESGDAKTGTFELLEPERTQLRASTNSVTHTDQGIDPVGHENTWSVNWTAPESSPDEVTFYAAVNAANGNGDNSGDKIYLTSKSYTQFFVGIADNSLNEKVKLYPNPATSFVNVDLPADAELRLVNITGQELMSQKNTSVSERIDLSNLSKGIYFIQIIHNSEHATIKLLKN